jgi:hypothetical protein
MSQGSNYGKWPWDKGFKVIPLQPELYGIRASACSRQEVQNARTVEEMFEQSGVPKQFWYETSKETKTTVVSAPKAVNSAQAAAVAQRVIAFKQRKDMDNEQLSRFLHLDGAGVVWRIEHGRIHDDEIAAVVAGLDRLEGKV